MKTVLRSHVGKVRQINEDQAWSGSLPSGITVAIVADGMGGHRAGDVASALAVDSMVQSLQAWGEGSSLIGGASPLTDMIRKANKVVYETASLNEQYHNMGTTVVAALVEGSTGLIGHIGDSRAYRLRAGRLEQLTEDHTLVNELTKSGQLSPEEAAHHPRRNVLTRALGTDREVEVDVQFIDWQLGDRILLCSDGLSGLVEDSVIEATLGDSGSHLEQQAEKLIDLALAAGGDDNITVVLVSDEGLANATGGETA
ncbi:Stp1/IreP family PP2C-type Ser/Thr phosphatase [Cohnella cholangitidis]|uniref:Stp1/IreP family PP2C-type Ser/Thr phosphatase n=1 Tax=Cohnella cholangitidis TaxID=2598458 RepID=A0A7G5BTH2_9BACL|nr:Stp1/IreP family PP2C-type Ser/Thr phosphatase [Cohnella cholangitidis]QMV40256.1 Stp1/IreP family PP2C-type Ser/Thr phosphatase [Cohnella cholangitidis]